MKSKQKQRIWVIKEFLEKEEIKERNNSTSMIRMKMMTMMIKVAVVGKRILIDHHFKNQNLKDIIPDFILIFHNVYKSNFY